MKPYLRKLVFVPFLTFLLTGCESLSGFVNESKQAQDGCKMTFKKDGGWSIAGIEIPTTRLVAGTTVKIGNLTFNPDEAYQLTETAQVLEQARLTSCALISSAAFRSMSDTYKAEGFKIAFGNVANMTNFAAKVKAAATPAEALAAAAQAKVDVVTPPPVAKPLVSIDERLESIATTTLAASQDATRALEEVASVNGVISKLRNDVEVWRSSPQSARIEIVGFPTGATSLPPASRDMLFSKVGEALNAIQAKHGALVLVVGYADASGTSHYNVELGLRRAQNVIEILQRQPYLRSFESKAASGGIDTGATGRHVKIFVFSTV